MSKIDDGGPVAPNMVTQKLVDLNTVVEDTVKAKGGLSIRDYFAAAALNGEVRGEDFGGELSLFRSAENAQLMARRAYQLADAMLAARKEGA